MGAVISRRRRARRHASHEPVEAVESVDAVVSVEAAESVEFAHLLDPESDTSVPDSTPATVEVPPAEATAEPSSRFAANVMDDDRLPLRRTRRTRRWLRR